MSADDRLARLLERATVPIDRRYELPAGARRSFRAELVDLADDYPCQGTIEGDCDVLIDLGVEGGGRYRVTAPEDLHDTIGNMVRALGGRRIPERPPPPRERRPPPREHVEQVRLWNPAGYPASGQPRQLALGDELLGPPVALFRPRLSDGTRPRLYVTPGAPLVELEAAVLAAEAGEDVRGRAGVEANVEPGLPGLYGAPDLIYTAHESGCPVGTAARYVIAELGDVVASHSGASFGRRPEYPAGIQERQYHRDKAEQEKIIDQARCFLPELLANTNPDAVNGPPIVGIVGGAAIVLGGNSRTMTLERVYAERPEAAAAYVEALVGQAEAFGFVAGDVATFKRPILTRLVDVEGAGDQELRELVRRYNESLTQGMDPTAYLIAVSNRISDRMLAELAGGLPDDGSTTAYAWLSSSASRRFVDSLVRGGVIDRRTKSQYLVREGRHAGLLNEHGRQLILGALVGRMIPVPEVLDDMPASVRDNLAGAAPFILQAAAVGGPEWDLTADLATAARWYMRVRASDYAGTLSELRRHGDLGELTGEIEREIPERVEVLVEVLLTRSGKRQIVDGFRAYAKAAAFDPADQPGFGFAETSRLTPMQALTQAFGIMRPASAPQASIFNPASFSRRQRR